MKVVSAILDEDRTSVGFRSGLISFPQKTIINSQYPGQICVLCRLREEFERLL